LIRFFLRSQRSLCATPNYEPFSFLLVGLDRVLGVVPGSSESVVRFNHVIVIGEVVDPVLKLASASMRTSSVGVSLLVGDDTCNN
jgi:hypothetical protein